MAVLYEMSCGISLSSNITDHILFKAFHPAQPRYNSPGVHKHTRTPRRSTSSGNIDVSHHHHQYQDTFYIIKNKCRKTVASTTMQSALMFLSISIFSIRMPFRFADDDYDDDDDAALLPVLYRYPLHHPRPPPGLLIILDGKRYGNAAPPFTFQIRCRANKQHTKCLVAQKRTRMKHKRIIK